MNFPENPMAHEGIKLRLRGKGSGFLEGIQQRESEDPLNLCVSSKDKFKYNFACQHVEQLLIKVYNEYLLFDKGKFCMKYPMHCLQIKKEEN